MMGHQLLSLAIYCLSLIVQSFAHSLSLELEVRAEITSRLISIHVLQSKYVSGLTSFTYGACEAKSEQDSHHIIGRIECTTSDSRLVCIIPQNAPTDGCISAWNKDDTLAGRSPPQNLYRVVNRATTRRRARQYTFHALPHE